VNRKDRRWWNEELGTDVHETICGIVVQLIHEDPRRALYAQWRALYCDEAGPKETAATAAKRRRSRHNLVASLVDAAQAKRVKQQPKPQILTTEGDTIQQRKAKELTDWVAGEFERLNLYEDLFETASLESEIVGTGVAKICARDGKPYAELCYAEDIFLDPREQRHNCVRTFYHARAVDRWVLAEAYPDHEQAIMDAPPSELDVNDDAAVEEMADLILVIEAWRLASGEKYKGRHVICVGGATLRHVEYTKTKPPFRRLTWKPKPRSWFGIGLVEGEAGQQAELNALTESASVAYERCVPMVIVGAGMKLNRHQMEGRGGEWAWYECGGDARNMQVFQPTPVLPDVTMREDRLIARSFERQRISQMSAQGQKPAGLNSGKALIVHNDIDAENHVVANRAYERFVVEVGEALIEVAEDLIREAKENGEEPPKLITYAGKNSLQEIAFDDVRLSDQPMVMRAFPVSSLPSTPSGRYEMVADMMEAGLVPIEKAQELLENPDIDAYTRRAFAARKLIDNMLDEAMSKGRRTSDLVSRYMDLQYSRKQAWLAYNEAIFIKAPQDHIDAIEEICGAIETTIKQLAAEEAEEAAAQAAAMAPPPMPMPPGPMMPPPTGEPMPMPTPALPPLPGVGAAA
jgi:hypothetical protein